MRSHPVGLDVWFLVGPFIYFHSSCVRTAKALVRLRRCAGSLEPSLVTYEVSTIYLMSWLKCMLILIVDKEALHFALAILLSTFYQYLWLKVWRALWDAFVHFVFCYNSYLPSDLHLSHLMTKPTKWLCAQWTLRSAWASTQSDQSLRFVLMG